MTWDSFGYFSFSRCTNYFFRPLSELNVMCAMFASKLPHPAGGSVPCMPSARMLALSYCCIGFSQGQSHGAWVLPFSLRDDLWRSFLTTFKAGIYPQRRPWIGHSESLRRGSSGISGVSLPAHILSFCCAGFTSVFWVGWWQGSVWQAFGWGVGSVCGNQSNHHYHSSCDSD